MKAAPLPGARLSRVIRQAFHCSRDVGAALALLLASAAATCADLVLVNADNPGEGFNDTTAAAPVGGNPAETLGEQRLQVFAYAAKLAGSAISSSVPIFLEAKFDSLPCDASSAIVGEAGPQGFYKDFGNAPQPQTFYVQAQANSLAGSDIAPGVNDISITFNGDIDNNSNCLNSRNWYYGLDGNPTGNDLDLLTTVLHEIVHGLGFLTLVDLNTGAKHNPFGCPATGCDDAYMLNIEDHSLGNTWPNLNDAQRAASATDDPDLHFTGASVQANLAGITGGINAGHARLHAPSPLNASSVEHLSTALQPFELMEPQLTDSADSLGLAGHVLQDMGWNTPASAAPVLSTPKDVLMLDTATRQIDIAVLDNDTSPGALVLQASSSNPSIVPNPVASGSGRLRMLQVSPNAGNLGTVTITVTVDDGSNTTLTQFDVAVTDDLPPDVNITSPADATVFYAPPQNFSATALDPEQGDISGAITWSSSLDGSMGSGASVVAALSQGSHQVTAAVVDNGSNLVNASITVTVDITGDADGDGLPNGVEIALGTDPEDPDTDNDFSSDYAEVSRDGDPSNYTPGVDTDPNNPDTDGDGIVDGADYAPLDPDAGGEQVPLVPWWGLVAAAVLLAGIAARNIKS